MQKYKVSVTKNQKRYALVISAENEIQAKERVHKEWYSILGIEKIDTSNLSWTQFIFLVEKDGEVKSWKVVWEDIFKIYLKLKKALWYHVLSLYYSTQKDISDDEKQKIIQELEEQYSYYIQKEDNKATKKEEVKNPDTQMDNFYMKKELEETYKFIDFVLSKVSYLLENPHSGISQEKRDILKRVYNGIIQIKKTTNISKLKEAWEMALLKVWEIEVRQLEKNKSDSIQKHLKQTNKLLKEVGSNKKFIPQNKDISYLLKTIVWDFSQNITNIFKKKKRAIDTHSYEYIKNSLVLQKYREKLRKNTLQIIINAVSFLFPYWKNIDTRDGILLERRVLQQNISLLQAKLKWGNFSYSRIMNFRLKIHNFFIGFIQTMRYYIGIILFCYTLLFLSYFITLSYFPDILHYISFSPASILYIVILIMIYIILYLMKWFISSLISLVLFSFICIFLLVNF